MLQFSSGIFKHTERPHRHFMNVRHYTVTITTTEHTRYRSNHVRLSCWSGCSRIYILVLEVSPLRQFCNFTKKNYLLHKNSCRSPCRSFVWFQNSNQREAAFSFSSLATRVWQRGSGTGPQSTEFCSVKRCVVWGVEGRKKVSKKEKLSEIDGDCVWIICCRKFAIRNYFCGLFSVKPAKRHNPRHVFSSCFLMDRKCKIDR